MDIELEVSALEAAAGALAAAGSIFTVEKGELAKSASQGSDGWSGQGYDAFRSECGYMLSGVYEPGCAALDAAARVLGSAAEAARGLCADAASAASALGGEAAAPAKLRYCSADADMARQYLSFAESEADSVKSLVASATDGVLLETTSCDLGELSLSLALAACKARLKKAGSALSLFEAGLSGLSESLSTASEGASEAPGLVVGGSGAIYSDGSVDVDLVRELMSRPPGMVTPTEMALLAEAYSAMLAAGDSAAAEAFIGAGLEEVVTGTERVWVEASGGNSGYYAERPVTALVASDNLSLFLGEYFGRRYEQDGGESAWGLAGGGLGDALMGEIQATLSVLAGALALEGPRIHVSIPIGDNATAYYDTFVTAQANSGSDVEANVAIEDHRAFLTGFTVNTEGCECETSRDGLMVWTTYTAPRGLDGHSSVTAKAGVGKDTATGDSKVEYSVESAVSGGSLESAVGVEQGPPTDKRVQAWSDGTVLESAWDSPRGSFSPAPVPVPSANPDALTAAEALLLGLLILLPPVGVPG